MRTTITDMRNALESGVKRPSEVLESTFSLAKKHENLNALHYVDHVSQIRIGAEKIRPGLLSGIPFVSKDNINTNEFPTSGGTPILEANTPKSNAPIIERLLAEGAVLIAKANMHELAFGITSNNAAMGAVRNPHDGSRISGGSSGGTAAAVAAGIVPFGLGTDTGGSCRIPAALCGVVGFRPSTGRYSSEGVIPISHTRDTVGPIANTVDDIILLDSIMAEAAKPVSNTAPQSLRLGVDYSVLCSNLEPEVKKCFDETIVKLKKSGVEIVEIDLSKIWEHNAAFSFPVVLYEVMCDLPAYLEKHAPQITFEQLINGIKSPDVLGAIQSQLGEDRMPDAAYQAAINIHLPEMRKIYEMVTKDLDAIIFPTTPLRATEIGQDETVTLNGESLPIFSTFIRNTDLGSNLGIPGISIPAKTDGLPIGIELDGKLGRDEELLSIAKALENIITT